MKKILVLLSTVMLAACGISVPEEQILKSLSYCKENGGVSHVNYYLDSFAVHCADGASYFGQEY